MEIHRIKNRELLNKFFEDDNGTLEKVLYIDNSGNQQYIYTERLANGELHYTENAAGELVPFNDDLTSSKYHKQPTTSETVNKSNYQFEGASPEENSEMASETDTGDNSKTQGEESKPTYDGGNRIEAEENQELKGSLESVAVGDSTIESGDTLWGYAQESGHSVATLALLNGISDPNMIVTGETIDVNVDKDTVKLAMSSISEFTNVLDTACKEFNLGNDSYSNYGLIVDNQINKEIDEIKKLLENNINTLKEDAENYSSWLNKILTSLENEENSAYGVMGDTDLLINEIDG